MATKILIDTDPGIDDAMAILFSLRCPELEVVALTSVFGNVEVELATQNALRLVELEENDHVPVAHGAARPLAKASMRLGKHVHGEDGMGDTNLPPPKSTPIGIPAAQFIVETVMAHPGEITLAPIGPLTNLALALQLEPKISTIVKEVVLMGGAATVPGNASPVAEANVFRDPHAASIVFGAGWSVTQVGLDVTSQCVMTKAFLEQLGQADNPASSLLGRILPFYQEFYESTYELAGGIHTHDFSAIAYVLDPSLFRSERWPIYVETEGRCAGQTIPDRRGQWGEQPMVNICLEVDAPRVIALYKEYLIG